MGNCCSTESTNPTAHARRSSGGDGGGANPANVHGVSAVPLQNGGSEFLKPLEPQDKQQQQPQQQQTNGAENGGVAVVKEVQVDAAVAKQLQQEPQQEPPRSQSKKSVASGRTQPEGPGPTHSVQIGDYNLRYSYYSKRGYYPEGRRLCNSFRHGRTFFPSRC